jgi:hypothetical protein
MLHHVNLQQETAERVQRRTNGEKDGEQATGEAAQAPAVKASGCKAAHPEPAAQVNDTSYREKQDRFEPKRP